jgi:hypothetical protein
MCPLPVDAALPELSAELPALYRVVAVGVGLSVRPQMLFVEGAEFSLVDARRSGKSL